MSGGHTDLLNELTAKEKKHLLALEMVCVHYDMPAGEVVEQAKEFLDFLNTGDYEREELESEVVPLTVVPKEE